jgi:TRAP-type C4-dicarboxylate transport system permease small subunit
MDSALVGRAFDWLQRLLAVALVVAVALDFAAVVGRYVLGVSVVGADELQIFLMVWIAFLGAAIVTWRERHLRMDVLAGFLPRPARAVLRRAEAALLLVLAGVVVWESADYVRQMIALGRRSDAAGIPMAIPHAAVTIGFALVALIAAARLGRRAGEQTERS